MQFDGAVIKEQGVTFAVVVVKKHIIDNPITARNAQASFGRMFPGMPVVLMAQNHAGRPTYWGRADIAKFLSRTPMSSIPWKRYGTN